ncbi:Photosystem I reaction center subunit XI [Halomicronema hongdechloris C2206]|uniref:Photosystem I reaction center subunit XI n=1 Tax=Halomicronema hongdechloris C2206 TaxID=1641165 RepID=A0A1Z3HS05_9CYAN|nr:photosystem I reaction center protein subunit XI [Halomicronema hongdechloris]ASC73056.1 Photosystem I reaction center subunit XI [Halomicronema hongdechloris C2206]6KMW_aL Chain aL, Photosystem I reaction center subunit XI [Halomicronema hongdechloris C2206]6KMW_bL Chain bL, Photosystem I reaction center subunit XI [Halomicronema hongdechloris C2206]6KMW_cL Chain cL, Photosystem I reaction center subunit XI [Halomicronema hongdechloris C2206]
MTNQVVKPYLDEPELGHLSTPISDSAFVRSFIGNLPAYRKGMAPITRGLEIGLAHGYFLVGPEIIVGALRDYAPAPYLGGLVTAIAIVLLGTTGMGAHGLVSLKPVAESSPKTDALMTSEGWSEMTAGFFLGGMSGAFMAYFLLSHFSEIDAIFRGFVN